MNYSYAANSWHRSQRVKSLLLLWGWWIRDHQTMPLSFHRIIKKNYIKFLGNNLLCLELWEIFLILIQMSSRNEEIKWSNLQIGNEKFPYQNQKNCSKKSKVPTLPSSKEYIIVIVYSRTTTMSESVKL